MAEQNPYLEQARAYGMTVASAGEGEFVARVAEFPDTLGVGATPEAAAALLLEMVADTIEVLQADGAAVPQPDSAYSGMLHIRVPRSLHRELQQRAEREGLSLSAAAAHLLSRALGAADVVKPRDIRPGGRRTKPAP